MVGKPWAALRFFLPWGSASELGQDGITLRSGRLLPAEGGNGPPGEAKPFADRLLNLARLSGGPTAVQMLLGMNEWDEDLGRIREHDVAVGARVRREGYLWGGHQTSVGKMPLHGPVDAVCVNQGRVWGEDDQWVAWRHEIDPSLYPSLYRPRLYITEWGWGPMGWRKWPTGDDFFAWLIEADARLARYGRSPVVAANLYALGDFGGWPDWDVRPIADRLLAHVEANRPRPWEDRMKAASEPSQPPTQPPPAMPKIKLGHIYTGDFLVTQRFGANPDRYARFGFAGHEGVDIGCPLGTPCIAPFDGTVVVVRDSGNLGYGRHLYLLDPAQRAQAVYAHLREVKVAVGQQIRRRQLLGLTGNTGNSTGPHLHFGLRRTDAQGFAINRDNGYKGFIDPFGPEVEWDLAGPDTPFPIEPPTERSLEDQLAEALATAAAARSKAAAAEAETALLRGRMGRAAEHLAEALEEIG